MAASDQIVFVFTQPVGSQSIAACNAVAFAVALAASLKPKPVPATASTAPPAPISPTMNGTAIARDHAQVDKQIGVQLNWGQR